MKYYVVTNCDNSKPNNDGNIEIKYIHEIPLKTIMFTITCLVGSVVPHLATKSYVKYALECLAPTIFNLCEGLLANLKEQLNRVKTEQLNNFEYGSIVVSLSLERIPLL